MSNFFLFSCFSFSKPFVLSMSRFQGCSIFLESGGSVPCVMSCLLSFHVCVYAYACACVCHAKNLLQVCNRCAEMLLGSSVCGDSACPLECFVYRAMKRGPDVSLEALQTCISADPSFQVSSFLHGKIFQSLVSVLGTSRSLRPTSGVLRHESKLK